MFDFFKSKPHNEQETIDFIPTIQVSPASTIFVECTPHDPHSASNIVVNSYISKTNRAILQTRVQWSRFKFITDNKQSIEELPFVTGNVYRCEPADLGSYIRAKVTSFDVNVNGSAQITIGPIRLDPTVKTLIDGAMYAKSLRSQVKVLEKHQFRNADMLLTDKAIHITEENSSEKVDLVYDMYEPRVELNPKDATKIFLRFEKDETNRVRKWLDILFNDGISENKSSGQSSSYRSQHSGSSKSKIFKGVNCPNKIEIAFLTRHCRDQFLFSLKAFICKESMKNEPILQNIESVQEMRNPTDTHKFFQFMSLKMEIYRLYNTVKEIDNDRNQKLKDITELQESIGEMTLTYTKIIEEKGKLANVDFNQSYSEISIRREQILGRKQMKQLVKENEGLKMRVRELNEEIQLREFFKKQNNESMMFNQTNNPFAKKGDSIYHMIGNDDDPNAHKGNMLELTKSYMALVKENEHLKSEKKILPHNNPNSSRDMINLLESLCEEDEDPATLIKKLKEQNLKLQEQLKEVLSEAAKKAKSQPSIRLNQSVAHQQSMVMKSPNASFVSQQKDGASFYSVNQSNLNSSLASEANIMMLTQKIEEINDLNRRTIADNNRLRQERDEIRQKYEKLKSESSNKLSPSQAQKVHDDLSCSNIFDRQGFDKLKQEKEYLQNQNNAMRKKLQSLMMEAGKGEPLLQKKNEEIEKEVLLLKQNILQLKSENQTLKQKNLETKSSDGSIQNVKQNQKLKKINVMLLEEVKSLKKQLENKNDPLYNSRVVQLQNQVNFLKCKDEVGHKDVATQKLLAEISKLQKENENLKRQLSDKQSKLQSQAVLIERLMSSHESGSHQSTSGKDKSYSETHNDNESNQKLKKKIRELQEEVVLMRRSADALNRSRDISMDMQFYNEEQLEIVRKEKEMLLEENERLSRMCEKYAKDAKEGVKWKKQALELMKTQKKEQTQNQ